jgi:hypothetical protein
MEISDDAFLELQLARDTPLPGDDDGTTASHLTTNNNLPTTQPILAPNPYKKTAKEPASTANATPQTTTTTMNHHPHTPSCQEYCKGGCFGGC